MCEEKHCHQKFGPLCTCSPVQARDTFQMAIHLAENITDVDWHLSYQSIEKSITACDTQKLALFEAYHSDNIDLDAFLKRKKALSDQQAQLRVEYQEAETEYAEKKKEFERFQEESRQIAEYLSGQSLPNDKALEKMYEAIDRVTIYGADELEIRWKFEDLFQNMRHSEH